MGDLTLQPTDTTGLKLWQGTGSATVEATTMAVDQGAIDVVQLKIITLQYMAATLENMDLTLSPQDGRLETGFAQESAVEGIIMLAGQNALNAKCLGILVRDYFSCFSCSLFKVLSG
ncbi:hypothetical protein VNO80_22016 [Phaseolus coccineus]|uniref:Uncharacterized protein n=1 Tax=Phaseolus coccineus TaxID=3886 RepID=A0AAN9M3C2_PHACN